MGAPVDRIDIVREAEHRLRIPVVVLQPDLHGHAAALGFHVNRLIVQHLFAAIQMLDELRDAAVVFEVRVLGLARLRVGRALVSQRDQQSLVKEREFAQALSQGVVVIFCRSKNAAIGEEVDFGPAPLGRARLLHPAGGFALGIGLLPGCTIAPNFQLQFLAQRVHARDANAVQSAGNLISGRIEFSPGVQSRHHYLRRGNFFAIDIHIINRNAAPVIDHRD